MWSPNHSKLSAPSPNKTQVHLRKREVSQHCAGECLLFSFTDCNVLYRVAINSGLSITRLCLADLI